MTPVEAAIARLDAEIIAGRRPERLTLLDYPDQQTLRKLRGAGRDLVQHRQALKEIRQAAAIRGVPVDIIMFCAPDYHSWRVANGLADGPGARAEFASLRVSYRLGMKIGGKSVGAHEMTLAYAIMPLEERSVLGAGEDAFDISGD